MKILCVCRDYQNIHELQHAYKQHGQPAIGRQQQRILLTCALYKRPSIVFLDKATSHSDNQLEQQITSAITNLQLTRVMIAHRLETIAASGRVIKLGHRQMSHQATHILFPANAAIKELTS